MMALLCASLLVELSYCCLRPVTDAQLAGERDSGGGLFSKIGHGVLDVAGLVPGVGKVHRGRQRRLVHRRGRLHDGRPVRRRPPGPLTDEMIDEAVSQGVAETDDLDWKSSLPPASGLPQTDFPKDIAAMANSGGGVIAYGVTEQGKQATGRTDTGELTEGHERSLRSVAVTAITTRGPSRNR